MTILSLLRAGSFKGAPFLVISATTTAGRKLVKHEFPNSALQSIEDLGFRPRTFSLVVETTADFIDDLLDAQSYFDNRNKLMTALESEGAGILSHPFFSTDIEVVALPYTVDEDTTELGVARFSLTFDISNAADKPVPDVAALPNINSKVNEVTDQYADDMEERFKVSNGFNLEEAVNRGQEFFIDVVLGVDKFPLLTATQQIIPATEKLNEFSSKIIEFQGDIVALVQAPAEFASAIVGTVQSVRGLYATAEAALNVYLDLFDIGDNLAIVFGTTSNRTERRINQSLLTDSIQGIVLAEAYQAASVREYETVEDVDEIKELLEDKFTKVVNAGLPVVSEITQGGFTAAVFPTETLPVNVGLSGDLITVISELRVLSNKFLDEKRLTAKNIIDITTNTTPLRKLAFGFYGEDDQDVVNSLIELNDIADITFATGELKVLSA